VEWIKSDDQLLAAGDGSIIECYWTKYNENEQEKWYPKTGEWKFMRKRDDKSLPNVDWVVKGISDSLASDILESELRGYSK